MPANLDLVRSICADWTRLSSADWADPEIEYVIVDGPAPGRWTGLPGLREAWQSVFEAWRDLRVEVEHCRELDGERVLALTRMAGHTKAGGIEIPADQARAAAVYHVRDGMVTRIVNYFDRDRALADLGLEE
jgi:ketosteroid isomerase-like protein